MSNSKALRVDNLRQFARRPEADFKLRLLAVKDLAGLLLEELSSAVGSEESTAAGMHNYVEKLYSGAGLNYYQELRQFEVELIRCALALTGGRQARAARLLGLKTTTLNTKIKQFNIQITTPKAQSPLYQKG
ncbi:MAG TPA: helix-turn-helix domain-containing protein [Pyrinomonadaceae bacterium]|jgi:DNA-binding NtrC family response regulator